MTTFEGMCFGFLAGVVMSLISFLLGALIDRKGRKMSIFNDPRRYSDNEEEYQAWKQEALWECRRDNEYIDEWERLEIEGEEEDD